MIQLAQGWAGGKDAPHDLLHLQHSRFLGIWSPPRPTLVHAALADICRLWGWGLGSRVKAGQKVLDLRLTDLQACQTGD